MTLKIGSFAAALAAAAFGVSAAGEPHRGAADHAPLEISLADADRGYVATAMVVADRRASRAIPVGSLVDPSVYAGERDVFAFGGVARAVDARTRYTLVRLVPGADAADVSARLSGIEGLSAQPVVVGRATADSDRPNDPAFRIQYALENIGQTIDGETGFPGADIRVLDAWERQTGSPDVVIAVIDAGIASSHPDLADKLLPGFNVVGPDPDDTDAPFNSHGTEVAGVAAASSNNGEGLTGVSWGSSILPVTAANVAGFTSDLWLAEGLVWAADHGADIAVLSFGLNQASDVLADAVAYATLRGTLVCASVGNTGSEGVLYPAAYPEALGIGATDSRDQLATFSTRGDGVDLVAPGVNIFTCTHTVQNPDTYVFATGTSISTPIVAGVAALMKSADPMMTVAEIKAVLLETAQDLGPEGWDSGYGFGRVDAARAIAAVLEPWSCVPDVNRDGLINSADFFAWLIAYEQGSPRADQNLNGVVEAGDFFAFVQSISSGQRCASGDPLSES